MKRYLYILAALAASMLIWLISNLSKDNTGVVTIMVQAHSTLEGRSDLAVDAVPVVASVTTSGFRLLQLLNQKSKPVHVHFLPSDLKQTVGDLFQITPSALYSHASDIFGADVGLQSVVSSNVVVRFPVENCKKVPVVFSSLVKFNPQYTSVGSIQVYPDSILIYGEPSRIEGITSVSTLPITGSGVKSDLHGTQKIETMSGVRLGTSSVSYSMHVSRFVEMESEVPLKVLNVPEGKNVIVTPSSVTVSYRVVFPLSNKVSPDGCLYIDYNDFVNSISGKCVVKSADIPSSIISFSVDPEICQCIER